MSSPSVTWAGPRPHRPPTTSDLDFWWDGLATRELRIQYCSNCRQLRHPPQVRCPACGSMGWEWQVATGTASLHSFVVYHAPVLPGTNYPYAVGVLALTEGVRVIAPISPPDGSTLSVGQPMRLRWDRDTTVGWWPRFEPEDAP